MNVIWEFVIGSVYVAIIYTLVRPGSPAADVVKTVSDALVGVVTSATGYHQA